MRSSEIHITQMPNVMPSTPSDGFALNAGLEDWQVDRVQDCYNAAQGTGLPFKLFISFDMTWVPYPTGSSLRIPPIVT
jgi:hypothetical protein